MNSNSILTSNLLDIVFENRNKDYGAYVLRRDYNKRLLKSLIMALAFVVMFIFWLRLSRGNSATNLTTICPFIPPTSFSLMKPVEAKKPTHFQARSRSDVNTKPIIVKEFTAKKEILPDPPLFTSSVGENIEAPFEAASTIDGNTAGPEIKEAIKSPVAVDKNVVITSPDIPPQFPGGIKELMKFLRRNLNTPQQLEEGEEIGVKVRFVVSYNGDLIGFNVIETGGAPFDDEVMRVLKRMPRWIPGKAAGENVSTYYIIPVKFRVSE